MDGVDIIYNKIRWIEKYSSISNKYFDITDELTKKFIIKFKISNQKEKKHLK